MGWLAKEPGLIPDPERGKRFASSPKHTDKLLRVTQSNQWAEGGMSQRSSPGHEAD